MVATGEVQAVNGLEGLVVTREYQGSSYGHVRFSGGDPLGHYRTVEFSSGVFSASDKRFNAYLRDQFAADVLALYNGESRTPSAEGQNDLHSGHSTNKRELVDGKLVETNYWSNAQRVGILPHDRMYAFTVRMETMPENVAELQERMTTYFTKLQQMFGLRSTNSFTEREAA
jgi:hypothetical protein